MVYKFIENITGLGIIVNDHIAEKLHKLVNKYKNTYHHFINKKPINVDYSAWTEKVRPILKLLSLKLMTESELLSIIIFLVKKIEN